MVTQARFCNLHQCCLRVCLSVCARAAACVCACVPRACYTSIIFLTEKLDGEVGGWEGGGGR